MSLICMRYCTDQSGSTERFQLVVNLNIVLCSSLVSKMSVV